MEWNTLGEFNSRLDEAKKGSVNSKTWQWNSYSQSSKKQNKKDEVKWRLLKRLMEQYQIDQHLHFRVWKGGERENEAEAENLTEIMAENIPNMVTETDIWI